MNTFEEYLQACVDAGVDFIEGYANKHGRVDVWRLGAPCCTRALIGLWAINTPLALHEAVEAGLTQLLEQALKKKYIRRGANENLLLRFNLVDWTLLVECTHTVRQQVAVSRSVIELTLPQPHPITLKHQLGR